MVRVGGLSVEQKRNRNVSYTHITLTTIYAAYMSVYSVYIKTNHHIQLLEYASYLHIINIPLNSEMIHRNADIIIRANYVEVLQTYFA